MMTIMTCATPGTMPGRRAIVAAAGLFAFTFALFAPAGEAAQIEVLHGGKLEIITVRSQGSLPHVIRAGAARAGVAAAENRDLRPLIPGQRAFVAGRKLWFLDPGGRRLTACSLRGSGYAGQRRIYCTTSQLGR